MNYKHSYHAGNFADVFKHCLLIALLNALLQKEKPMTYMETHAGAGGYALSSSEAQKTREYEQGILKLAAVVDPPETVQQYLKIVKTFNSLSVADPLNHIRLYPGSPLIASTLLRPHDQMILCEWQVAEYEKLKTLLGGRKNIAIHHQDGYVGLKAHLPPVHRRGLVLIDPPYEKPDEYTQLVTCLKQAIDRFETATYAVWYPIKNDQEYLKLLDKLNKIGKETYDMQWVVSNDKMSTQLIGCGMIVLNPPWQFEQKVASLLSWFQTLSLV